MGYVGRSAGIFRGDGPKNSAFCAFIFRDKWHPQLVYKYTYKWNTLIWHWLLFQWWINHCYNDFHFNEYIWFYFRFSSVSCMLQCNNGIIYLSGSKFKLFLRFILGIKKEFKSVNYSFQNVFFPLRLYHVVTYISQNRKRVHNKVAQWHI